MNEAGWAARLAVSLLEWLQGGTMASRAGDWLVFWPAGLGLLLAVFGIGIWRALRRRWLAFPYRPAECLFTPAERAFLRVLDQVVGPQFRVFGKVRIADVAALQDGLPPAIWRRALNRIAAKHLDFVICRADTLAIVCAIELNDRSHERPERQARDEFVAKVCQKIGLPLLMIPVQRQYAQSELRAQLKAVLPRL